MSRSLGFAFLLALLAGTATAAGEGAFDTMEEFARAVGMKKGGWQTRVKVTTAEIRPSPAADQAVLAEVRARIEKQIGQVEVKDECSKPSREGRPRLPGIVLEPGCSLSRLQASDGRWSLSCGLSQNDETGTLNSAGSYSRKMVTGRHEGDFTYKGVVVHLTAETESRWVGECRPLKPLDVTADGD